MNWTNPRSSDGQSYDRVPTEDDSDDAGLQLKQKIKQQDANLGLLDESVQRLGILSLNISKEIKEQNKMMDEVNDDMEEAIFATERITKKTEELVKAAGGCKYVGTILGLLLILIVLTALAIYG